MSTLSLFGPRPPRDEAELLARAEQLAGRTLGQLAGDLGAEVPPDLRHAKGWVGQLIERALGATAGSRAEPDFQHLGVELKTLPVDRRGRPLETTFVCTIALSEVGETPTSHEVLVVNWFDELHRLAPAAR